MGVHFKSRNDSNYNNSHIVMNGIEFVALPGQPYYGRMGDTSALVDKYFRRKPYRVCWGVTVFRCLHNGKLEPIASDDFRNKDKAFEFAAGEILKKEAYRDHPIYSRE